LDAVQSGETGELTALLKQLAADQDTSDWGRLVISKLLSIVGGDRHPQLADDPQLDFDDAVELKLLLERLA
jgi:hypothetical protein